MANDPNDGIDPDQCSKHESSLEKQESMDSTSSGSHRHTNPLYDSIMAALAAQAASSAGCGSVQDNGQLDHHSRSQSTTSTTEPMDMDQLDNIIEQYSCELPKSLIITNLDPRIFVLNTDERVRLFFDDFT